MIIAEAYNRRSELNGCGVVRTLYYGGGTPSWIGGSLLSTLTDGLRNALPLENIEEFTIEVNPDDITVSFARTLCKMRVNRVSMGVQSFVDAELRFMRRRHDATTAIQAVRTLREAGIDNISIDLIYGVPGQTLETWRKSVNQAIELDVQHISAYNLSYEADTPLWCMRERGEIIEVEDDTCVDMYRLLVALLKRAGYEHYEISNFALPGFHSRHNSSYWDGTPYLGLGAAAHSFDGRVRRCNVADLQGYVRSIDEQDIAYQEERLSRYEQYDEIVMLALRTAQGLDTTIIHDRFGQNAYEYLMRQAKSHIDAGNLTALGDKLRLTPQAVMMSDAIIRDLFIDNYTKETN